MRTKKPGIIIALFSLVLAILATVTILDIVRREVQLGHNAHSRSVQALVMKNKGLRLEI
jgi:Na+-translocating ferredoxin:NAD+ oxidoreductase RnfG subunit